MDKLNRLGWAEGISFISYGVRIGIRASREGLVGTLNDRLPPGWKPHPGQIVDRLYSFVVGGDDPLRKRRLLYLLYGDGTRVARDRELEPVLDAFESDLRLSVAFAARQRVFVHAGVVGWRGKAIVIAGKTFTGKTTLAAELVKLGAEYYSDEYAVLDLSGRVRPFPRPLSIRDPATARTHYLSVEEFGGRAGVKPLSVGMVVDTRYREGARWHPMRVSPGAGAMVLLANTVSARHRPARNLPVIRKAVSSAIILRGVRGEAATVARDLLARMDQADAEPDRRALGTF